MTFFPDYTLSSISQIDAIGDSLEKNSKQIGNLCQNENQTYGFWLLRMESIKPQNEVYFLMVQPF